MKSFENYLNYPVGSMQYVYFHGLWRLKRGRLISAVPYRNEHNPRKAFALASRDIQGWLKSVDKNIASAQFWLKTSRTPSKHNFPSDLDHVRDHAQKAGVTLAEIGTSEEELEQLSKNLNMLCAKNWLNMLRSTSNHNFPSDLKNVRDYVQKAGVTLAEIGTSEEELARIEKNLRIESAKFWLNTLRTSSTRNIISAIQYVRSYTQEAGVALAELGTSENELEQLKIRGLAGY